MHNPFNSAQNILHWVSSPTFYNKSNLFSMHSDTHVDIIKYFLGENLCIFSLKFWAFLGFSMYTEALLTFHLFLRGSNWPAREGCVSFKKKVLGLGQNDPRKGWAY